MTPVEAHLRSVITGDERLDAQALALLAIMA
jgi:hypothetical protein